MSSTGLLEGQYMPRNTITMRTYHTDIRDQRMRVSSREGREEESCWCSDEGECTEHRGTNLIA